MYKKDSVHIIRVPSTKQKESLPLTPNKQKNNISTVSHGKLDIQK